MLPDRARSLIRHLLAAYATKMRSAATDPSLQQSDRDYLHDEARLADATVALMVGAGAV